MKADEVISLAARTAMRVCAEGIDPQEWERFAEVVIEAGADTATAVQVLRGRPEGPEREKALAAAAESGLSCAVAALVTLVHIEGLENYDWLVDEGLM